MCDLRIECVHWKSATDHSICNAINASKEPAAAWRRFRLYHAHERKRHRTRLTETQSP